MQNGKKEDFHSLAGKLNPIIKFVSRDRVDKNSRYVHMQNEEVNSS